MTGNFLLSVFERLLCHFGPQYWWPGESPFEVAVGAVLTQNTNWANVEKAIVNLKERGVLSHRRLLALSDADLASLIRPAGYYNIKTKRLRALLCFLERRCGGVIEHLRAVETIALRQELLGVYGIGQETADSILLYALNKPVFVIDAYTKRVLSRHGLMAPGESYDAYQALFHRELRAEPRLFNEYHALIVRVGKEFCRPNPDCKGCPLGQPPHSDRAVLHGEA